MGEVQGRTKGERRNEKLLVRASGNLHVRLLLLKSVSSVVKLVVGAAISAEGKFLH